MVQVLPQVRVFQEFVLAPTTVIDPLRAFIFGPHYEVRTYAKAKSQIGLGAYDADADTTYGYPAREAGEIVDQDYVRLFMDDALIRYFEDDAGADQTFAPESPNKVILAAGSLQELEGYSRLAALPKDVEAGDWAKVQNPNDLSDVVTSQIRQVIREEIAGSFAAATSDSLNQADSTAGTSAVSAPGSSNYSASLDASAYDGAEDGNIEERYTITVVKSGAAGVAEIDVVSDSGNDNEFGKVVPTVGSPFAIGDRGLTITFTGAGNFVAESDEWVFDVEGDFDEVDPPTVDTSIAYTGPADATYIIEVIRGGTSPRIAFRTTSGVDAGEKDITLNAWNTIGQYGLAVFFTDGVAPPVGGSSSSSSGTDSSDSSVSGATVLGFRLCKGDIYYSVATAATQGRASTLLLADSLTSTIIAEADLNIEIYSKQNIEVTEKRYDTPGVYNFETDENEVTINSGITYYGGEGDPINGEPVVEGTMYLGYRALSQDWVDEVQTISDVSSLGNYFTDLSPENPLGFGVKKALENAGGSEVKFIGVATNDLAGYTTAVNKTLEREDVYSFVPLSQDQAILNMVVGHVESQSSPEKGRWRIAWVTQDIPSTLRLVGDDTTPLTGTISQFSGDTTGYRQVDIVGADFLTNGVKAGDELRYNYGVDSFGEDTYETGIVDSVISESQLLLLNGPAAPITVAVKMEVWRTLSTDEQVDQLVVGNTYSSRRIYNVLGGKPTMDGYSDVEDFYLAAVYAGLRGGSAPHQGLTNVEILGVDSIDYLVNTLNGNQLDELMNAGFWLTSQDPGTGDIYCRKQISTDLTDINTTEQSVTTNVDSQSYYYKRQLAPYIGKTNNVQATQALIEAQLEAAFSLFSNGAIYPTLGGQIITATITELRTHATQQDRLVIRVELEIPYPLNNIDLYLVI